MIAVYKKCYVCKYMKSDYGCATDYCQRGNEAIMFNEESEDNKCNLFEEDEKKIEEYKPWHYI